MRDETVTNPRRSHPTLVLDWDGTCTERDTLLLAVERFGDASLEPQLDAALAAGTMTHRQVMETEVAGIRAPLEEVVAYIVEHARVRAGLRELVERYDPLILSSSFHETIEPVLARERIRARVRANRVVASPAGWRIDWVADTDCDACGQPCKRGSLPATDVVYVGDGYSDRCAARRATRVFARAGLARHLDEHGVPYEPFESLHDVAAALP
jgi:2-hydroxy-3-keto-5-methylthiopentenyl-1-phosphate phosphatase